MASSKAQEEKNAKAIRELMKLQPNKQCFDCGQKGPVYANCTIGTFICTTCSGIHRELSHRCKSVSMSTFTSAEVEKLTTIGNEVAAKEWHASWNPSEYPAPDGNDTTYLRKFLFLTYQERLFSASASKGGDSATSPGSSKTKKSSSKTSRKESRNALPQPEPLSNILGPNIPQLDVGARDEPSWRAGPAPVAASAKKAPAPLINLLDDLVGPSTTSANGGRSTSTTSSKDLLGDLMSLNVAPAPTHAANPFGAAPVASAAPAVDQQQIAQMQTQVQTMQTAILSAKQQMTTTQGQIQQGQAVFNQLNPQQREHLSGLMQRYQAMTTQFTAMNQQYNAAVTKLQQMLAAAAAPPPTAAPANNMFNTMGSAPFYAPTTNTTGMFGGMGTSTAPAPSSSSSNLSSLYGTTPSTSSNNLYATSPNYTTTTSSSTNLFPPSAYSVSTTGPPPVTNGYSAHSSNDLFASLSAAPAAHTNTNSAGGYGAPTSAILTEMTRFATEK